MKRFIITMLSIITTLIVVGAIVAAITDTTEDQEADTPRRTTTTTRSNETRQQQAAREELRATATTLTAARRQECAGDAYFNNPQCSAWFDEHHLAIQRDTTRWPTTTRTTRPPRPARTTTTVDLTNATYIYILREMVPTGWIARTTDDDLLSAGAAVCIARATGTSFLEISLELILTGLDGDGIGMDPESAGALIGGGVSSFCPEYYDEMMDFMDTVS